MLAGILAYVHDYQFITVSYTKIVKIVAIRSVFAVTNDALPGLQWAGKRDTSSRFSTPSTASASPLEAPRVLAPSSFKGSTRWPGTNYYKSAPTLSLSGSDLTVEYKCIVDNIILRTGPCRSEIVVHG